METPTENLVAESVVRVAAAAIASARFSRFSGIAATSIWPAFFVRGKKRAVLNRKKNPKRPMIERYGMLIDRKKKALAKKNADAAHAVPNKVDNVNDGACA